MKEDIKKLLDRAKSGRASEDDSVRLLEYFLSGLDLRYLGELLSSDQPFVVKNAAWILSELGRVAKPLLPVCGALLTHSDKSVRFDALDSVLANASDRDGSLVAQCIMLIVDPETSVQWKCLNFLRRIELSALTAASKAMDEGLTREHMDWLLAHLQMSDERDIITRASNSDFRTRAFAAVAAARLGLRFAPILKHLADPNGDAVARFARDELEELTYRTSRHDTRQ